MYIVGDIGNTEIKLCLVSQDFKKKTKFKFFFFFCFWLLSKKSRFNFAFLSFK